MKCSGNTDNGRRNRWLHFVSQSASSQSGQTITPGAFSPVISPISSTCFPWYLSPLVLPILCQIICAPCQGFLCFRLAAIPFLLGFCLPEFLTSGLFPRGLLMWRFLTGGNYYEDFTTFITFTSYANWSLLNKSFLSNTSLLLGCCSWVQFWLVTF